MGWFRPSGMHLCALLSRQQQKQHGDSGDEERARLAHEGAPVPAGEAPALDPPTE